MKNRYVTSIKIAGVLLGLLIGAAIHAQQYPLFSNYFTQKYGFNPATITETDGVNLSALYRHQWVGLEGAPVTKLASVRSRTGKWGIGGYFFQDEAGMLQRTGGSFMAAYEQRLAPLVYLSAGVAGGYYNLRLRSDAQVRDQADLLSATAMDGKWFPDFNVGVHLQARQFFVGLSVPQVLERQIQFTDAEDATRLQRHYYLTTGYYFQLNQDVQLQPAVLIKLAEGGKPQYDASLRAIFLDRFWAGGSYRINDAAVAMAGIKLTPQVELTYAYDFTTSNLRTVSDGSHEIGLSVRLGGEAFADADRDGVPDEYDHCPNQSGPRNNDGCPFDIFSDDEVEEEHPDSDRDGIWDEVDDCPEVPGPYANQGCPWADRDFDGIRDEVDECPGLAGVENNNGCPLDDRDQDGIVDQFDECPDEPGTFISRGCPDTDYDHDGILNTVDACPNTYGPASNEGCPIVAKSELRVLNVAMRNLYFSSNQAQIFFKAYPHLDHLAELMQERSDWQLVIIGHTDDRGSAESNLEVSRRRAEAVLFYMINQGVSREQLVLEYYGESDPFTSNDTEAGRQLNRRVELKFRFD